MARAILVDPERRVVSEIYLKLGNLEFVQSAVGGYVEQIPLASVFRRHVLLVDEDARLKGGLRFGWRLQGVTPALLNRGLICGTTGIKWTGTDLITDDVEASIQWLGLVNG